MHAPDTICWSFRGENIKYFTKKVKKKLKIFHPQGLEPLIHVVLSLLLVLLNPKTQILSCFCQYQKRLFKTVFSIVHF